MSKTPPPADHRIWDLLTVRACWGLPPEEQQELDRLLAEHPGLDPDALDRVAAMLQLRTLPETHQPLPAHLHGKLAAALKHEQPQPAPAASEETAVDLPPRPRLREIAAWVVAAACVLVAMGIWVANRTPQRLSLREQRAEFITSARDAVTLPWTATEDPNAQGASGDVVWSDQLQTGYMLFKGLAPNNPTEAQYQLWIFDAQRPEATPVDGGVFDVGQAETIVPIDPKLKVTQATLFAVTLEKPGGVVVSDRQRLPLLAKRPE